jgi:hypothetical protein
MQLRCGIEDQRIKMKRINQGDLMEDDEKVSTEQLIEDTLDTMFPNNEPGEEIGPLHNEYD